MTAISKNVYFDKLDDIVDKYNNRYHRTIKMKPANVTSGIYVEYGVEHNEIIEKQKYSAKGYTPNWSKKFLLLKKVKILYSGHMLLMILTVKKLLKRFMKKNCKKTN